ncbi:unnamed protein product [Effrenium voratum]|nr:unnamed protein product [Effrenium voratum]|mmetsp:Transcript_49005/g.116621  ORF Transcript_49005/g.116621 Transcript_49005/m.116621 type:complete len:219 (-) Transcript_49005:71-727(-)
MRLPMAWRKARGASLVVLAVACGRCSNFLFASGKSPDTVARPELQCTTNSPNQERPMGPSRPGSIGPEHSLRVPQRKEPALQRSQAKGEPVMPLMACRVEERRLDGSTLLEQWFIEKEMKDLATSDFETWRMRGPGAVSVLCQPAPHQAEEIQCLECVGHVSDLPFTPSSPTLDAMVAVLQARLVTPWRNGHMGRCRSLVHASSEHAFCKAAALTVPA